MSDWKLIAKDHPPAHAKYLVRRNGLWFTATPCYGMHSPWWVVRTMAEDWPNEADPVPMLPTDEWQPIPAPPEADHDPDTA